MISTGLQLPIWDIHWTTASYLGFPLDYSFLSGISTGLQLPIWDIHWTTASYLGFQLSYVFISYTSEDSLPFEIST